jgi:hypothetical protein
MHSIIPMRGPLTPFPGTCRTMTASRFLGACAGLLSLGILSRPAPALGVEGAEEITAVAARASSDYVRVRLANGRFQPEMYSFGEGGYYQGPMRDTSIDALKFLDVAKVIAKPLADQNYLPASDPAKTRLLIMVYWGLTGVPVPATDAVSYANFGSAQQSLQTVQLEAMADAKTSSPAELRALRSMVSSAQDQVESAAEMIAIDSRKRDLTDFSNAQLLGYDGGLLQDQSLLTGPLKERREDLVSEIEDNRYFVVLMAYDFQVLWKQKKHKLLWETRFSLAQRRHTFDKELTGMAKTASKFFGQDSHGLVREQIKEGRVDVGPLKSLGEVTPK